MSSIHLTISERFKIETYLKLGFSIRKIAKPLERQPSRISRELKWNPSYDATNAGRRYEMQKKKCGARMILNGLIGSRILEKLNDKWSP